MGYLRRLVLVLIGRGKAVGPSAQGIGHLPPSSPKSVSSGNKLAPLSPCVCARLRQDGEASGVDFMRLWPSFLSFRRRNRTLPVVVPTGFEAIDWRSAPVVGLEDGVSGPVPASLGVPDPAAERRTPLGQPAVSHETLATPEVARLLRVLSESPGA